MKTPWNKKWTWKDIDEMLRLRYEDKLTLREIGERYNFSRERARELIGNTGILVRVRKSKKYFRDLSPQVKAEIEKRNK